MEPLAVSLEAYNAETVKLIAYTLGLIAENENARKDVLVGKLQRAIPARAASRDLIAGLPQAQRAALALTLARGGQIALRELVRPLVLSGLARLEDSAPLAKIKLPLVEDIAAELLRTGLLLNLTTPDSSSTKRTLGSPRELAIAPEVLQVLPQDLLKFPDLPPVSFAVPAPPRVVVAAFEDYVRRLFFIWAELRRQPAKTLKSGGLGKRDLRRIATGLALDLETEEETLRSCLALLRAAGLTRETTEQVIALDDAKALGFWENNPVAQLRLLLEAYPNVNLQLDFDISPLLEAGYGYQQIVAQSSGPKHREILDLLRQIPGDTWFSFAMFMGLLNRGRAGDFMFTPQLVDSYYQRLGWYSWRENLEKKRVELARMLQETEAAALWQLLIPLSELGSLELGYAEQGGLPVALRPSAVARAAFGGEMAEFPSANGQIILQPDFQVLALGPVPLQILAALEYCAVREKLQPAAVSYRLTRDSVYAAFQRGQSPAALLAMLAEVTGQPAPQNVARTVQEWGAQHERIVARRDVLVLQADSPAMLTTLLADAEVGALLHPLDESTAWASSDHASRIERRLWQLAQLPAVSRGPQADLPHSLRWDGDALCARHPLPSLYVVGALRRIAEETEHGWRLTQKSVRAAATSGLAIPDVVALIVQMTGSPLSPEREKQFKAWGSHYGAAQTAEVRLLQLENAETLAELRKADARLRRWLRPLTPRAGNLAVVNEKHWDEVLSVLEEWGVAVEEGRWW